MKRRHTSTGMIPSGTFADLVEEKVLRNDPHLLEALQSAFGRVRDIRNVGQESGPFRFPSWIRAGGLLIFQLALLGSHFGSLEPAVAREFEQALRDWFVKHPDWKTMKLLVDRGDTRTEEIFISSVDEDLNLEFANGRMYVRVKREEIAAGENAESRTVEPVVAGA